MRLISLDLSWKSSFICLRNWLSEAHSTIFPLCRRLNELILPLPSHKSAEHFSFLFFNNFIYRCQKSVEEWFGALVFYAVDVLEGKQWASQWLVLFFTDALHLHCFISQNFLFWLSAILFYHCRSFSSLHRQRFGGKLVSDLENSVSDRRCYSD